MGPLGYRSVPTSDPEEQRLREIWYATRGTPEHRSANEQLSAYLWKRTCAEIETDRRKHPKAKRNQRPGNMGAQGKNRYLP